MMSWLVEQLRAKARRGDLIGVWSIVLRTFSERYFEWHFGISTSRASGSPGEGLGHEEFHCYEATEYRTLRAIMARTKVRAGEDVFLDLGAGKGRALVVAATLPFRRVLGVEISPGLAKIASENLHRARPRLKCLDAQVICDDATAIRIPDDVSVVFLFNSFHGEVLVRALLNIKASVERRPRYLRLLFVNPRYVDDAVQAALRGWLQRSEAFTAIGGEYQTTMYETRASKPLI